PEMDGLATLAELRKTWPHLPVIMFSALTERGATATLDALALGATHYFTKPACVGGLDASLEVVRKHLIPEIKALCQPKQTVKHSFARLTLRMDRRILSPSACGGPIGILAIGASTGGPNALGEVFSKLAPDLPVPMVVVQHMPPMFTRLLAERLTCQF